jgi:DNA-binding winged helix-turn-helix (wHTH) protein/tetratricopeptide (TPR) repeat protein
MPGMIRFGPFTLDPRSGELRRDEEIVPLPPQPARLLRALAARPGELMTRDELRQLVWDEGTNVDFERGLNFCILQVRNALGDDAKKPAYIETLPKRGYRFVAPIAHSTGRPPRESRSVQSRGPQWLAAVVLSLTVIAVAAWRVERQSGSAPAAALTSRNPVAHEAYLRGRQLWSTRKTDAVDESVRELRTAVRLEPSFVLAHVALAESLHLLAMREGIGSRQAGDEIRAASEAALRLAPSLAQSHAITAMHRFWYAWDWDGAEESYRQAIRLNPNEPGALHDHGWLLITRGAFDEGLQQIRRAQELDPVSPRANMHVAWAYIYTRRYDDAIRESRRALALSPGFAEALGCIEHAEMLRAGRRPTEPPRVKPDPYSNAVNFALAGDKETALSWLGKAKETRNTSFPLAGVDPKLDALNGDPRFDELLRGAGLTRRTRSDTSSPSRASRRS